MTQRNLLSKVVATVTIVALQGLFVPAFAEAAGASLSGAVLSASDRAPLVGATLHVGDPESGKIYSSRPTAKDGSFRVENLPAATYELAVESEGGLYVVGTPLELAPGQAQTVNVAVNPEMADDPRTAQTNQQPAKGSLWSNPATAALIVLGAAIVLGVVIDQATDDDNQQFVSPSN